VYKSGVNCLDDTNKKMEIHFTFICAYGSLVSTASYIYIHISKWNARVYPRGTGYSILPVIGRVRRHFLVEISDFGLFQDSNIVVYSFWVERFWRELFRVELAYLWVINFMSNNCIDFNYKRTNLI